MDNFHPPAVFKGVVLITVVWTVLVLASLITQREQLNRTAAELARIAAIASLKKDMTIREWASSVEGVFIREKYVPTLNSLDHEQRVTAVTRLNEPLDLVLVTPMHLLLAIHDMSNQKSGLNERLTSRQLHNRDNIADEWESKALEELEKGASIITETLPRRGGHGLMRVMIPMRMEEECLECHRDTLIPVGGLRGGASISIDLNSYRAAQEPAWRSIQYWHGIIWLLGLSIIALLYRTSRRRAWELFRQDQERRENEMAFAAMAEGAVITNPDGTILWVNDAFCDITGYRRDEVIGANPRMLKSGMHDDAFYARLWEQLRRDGHWRGEIWNRRKTGEAYPEEISIQALRLADGSTRRYISIFSDISLRKRNERELADHREHLEELVRQRTGELTVARDQAEAANRSKSTFLANMSHELRTPLNAVIGFSKLMEKDVSLSPDNRRTLAIINHSGQHLLTLINDILELSKIESGKMTMRQEEVDLFELLKQVTEMMRLRAEEQGLRLHLAAESLPSRVMIDPGMLRQVLLNLLSNAVKFTERGTITLRASARTVSDVSQQLRFSVRDTGIGIRPDDQQRIFSSFEQVGSVHRAGTGLGLTISRRYVRMMGGELAVDSRLGEGAEFHFTITVPVADGAQPRGAEAPPPAGGPGRAASVLVVDDNPEGRMLAHAILEPVGFGVDEAATLEQAWSAVDSRAFDLVLLDWYLPDGEGIELLRRAAVLGARRPAIIMLTANALAESRAASLEAGADAFLSKPFDETELLHLIDSVLARRQPDCSTPPRTAPQDAGALLEALPPAERDRLVNAAISLNREEIGAAIEAAVERVPELAGVLLPLSTECRYRQLWELLDLEGNQS
ncbi:ATP-binding protein [Thauera linaloolentis]|uniref:Virulence sensor protein BvgS n=1 Tax=Thauera linaloolentis (strain DSM 12138 / JCM 21573 / CCUG 41526 / CIP 105981 / IAM 15112 / NBRC 102519 / 47Lol) TaxID=1123367 RepID=N6YDL9_THAL4|nr:ATP-binding protein [Thauera linaloolentis]ENO89640.1 PAS/PAC sensor hybrid histidine kinase [Thauera linaloolentis 47Lol = DSM 12138]MCM8567120.1 ATP-binding protein [Thauera linaloolentis]